MGNSFDRIDVSMEISQKKKKKSRVPMGNSHLPVGNMGNLAAPILGRIKRICYGQRLTFVVSCSL